MTSANLKSVQEKQETAVEWKQVKGVVYKNLFTKVLTKQFNNNQWAVIKLTSAMYNSLKILSM